MRQKLIDQVTVRLTAPTLCQPCPLRMPQPRDAGEQPKVADGKWLGGVYLGFMCRSRKAMIASIACSWTWSTLAAPSVASGKA
jgi:hypothetical protein